VNFRPKHSSTSRFLLSTFILTLTVGAQCASAAPVETVLYNFDVIPGGKNPQVALTAGPGGVYYGTTDNGGATGNGTVFEFTPPAAGQSKWTEKVIYSFSGAPDVANPSSALLVGSDSAIYGVAGGGGEKGAGTVFKLTPPAAGQTAWTETVLFSFDGHSDGKAPYGTLIADANGVLYGSTAGGGNKFSSGVVFSLTPPSAGGSTWTETVLHTFRGNLDGASPTGGLVLDENGALYGMTSVGGLSNGGTIYRLTPPAVSGGEWDKTTLWAFSGEPDGAFPNGGLVRDANGIFYGTTNAAGATGWGTVFALTPPSKGHRGWNETVLYSFTGGADGGSPDATPVLAADGTIYGTSNAGGTAGSGTVYALAPPAQGQTAWTEAALVSFTGPNGYNPAGLSLDGSGGLIGTTFYGGTLGGGGGTIFTLAPPQAGGTAWTQTVVQQFPDPGTDAASPLGALLMTKSGALFGTGTGGGTHNHGAVFELTPPAQGETAWHRTLLYSFKGADGAFPTGKLVQDGNGVLYGMTTQGGPDPSNSGNGVVYALVPPAAGQTAWTEKVLHAFKGVAASDGAFPGSGLIADKSGALYGTTGSGGIPSSDDPVGNGIVFKLNPSASGKTAWTESVIHRFKGPDGSTPDGALLFGKDGTLYGTTYVGGSVGEGTVFSLAPPTGSGKTWNETVLHSFNASIANDGAIPGAEQLVIDASGALYGTASQGGAGNSGMVFKLAPPTGSATDWTETVIHSFTGTDGTFPFVGVLANKSGALFGVTEQGGKFQYGTVFKLTPPATGTDWTATVLHDFNPAYGRDGADAASALVKDAKGNLYGEAAAYGYGAGGIVFEVTP
jgi:uncharacterized repeat protein (TIGR03803 family)